LGDTVNYNPSLTEPVRAAVVIEVHSDGTVDLRVWGGYCQGSTDLEKVAQSDWGDPGTFFYPKGVKGGDLLKQPMNDTTDTAMILQTGGLGEVGDWLLVEEEYMVISSVTSPTNWTVTRAQGDSTIAAHAAGRLVKIGVVPPA
jgi:hypothetical protein